MNLQPASPSSTGNDERPDDARTRLHGRWLVIARVVRVALVVFTLSIFIASLPAYFAQIQTVCVGVECVFTYGQLTPGTAQALQSLGFSTGGYAVSTPAFAIASTLVFLGVAGVLFWMAIVYPVGLLLIPLTLGIAILRYRLWDIDILINRTLVYGTLTGLLALVYFGLVITLQALFKGVTGQVGASPLVIVSSTLVIAALFQPLRHRIQKLIDRRFYHRKYDDAKTFEAFNATLRNEVDLTELSEQLVAVVQETMQPAHVSLWLRPTAQDR